jgi:hypothetical protein
VRGELARFTTHDGLREVVQVLADRISSFEALMQTRFDTMLGRVAKLIAEHIRTAT